MANVPDRLDSVRVPDDLPKVTGKPDGKVPNAVTYTLMRECHTLGNLLRMCVQRGPARARTHARHNACAAGLHSPTHPPPSRNPSFHRRELLRDPAVKFAGYKHPHPLENDIQIKVQAHSSASPNDVMLGALRRLMDEATGIRDSFREQVNAQRAREEQIGGA